MWTTVVLYDSWSENHSFRWAGIGLLRRTGPQTLNHFNPWPAILIKKFRKWRPLAEQNLSFPVQFQASKLPHWLERYETKFRKEITEQKMSRILSIHESIYLSKHLFSDNDSVRNVE
jgi:hypothetical protein